MTLLRQPRSVVRLTLLSATLALAGWGPALETRSSGDESPTLVPIHGVVTVGAGGTYTSLSNVGGLFSAMNSQGVDGNITALIISDLGNEAELALLPFAAPFTLTIEASGGQRTISGVGPTALIVLNGADRVTINGLPNGPNGLIFRNTGAGAVLRLASDASDNTISNCRFESSGGSVILLGDGVTTGNDNNRFENNTITAVTGFTAPILFHSSNTSASARNSNNQLVGNMLINWRQDAIQTGPQEENWTITNNNLVQSAPVTIILRAG